MTLATAAGLAGGVGPLAAGFLAGHVGLSWALAGLAVAPVCVLAGVRGQRGGVRDRVGAAGAGSPRSGAGSTRRGAELP